MVVLGHVLDGYLKANVALEARTFMEQSINLINAFHMPLFMMISGYVYSVAYFESYDHPKKYRIYRQVENLIALYIFFAVVFGLLRIVTDSLVGGINSEFTFKDIMLIWAKPYAPYWYLYVLIAFYLIFSVQRLRSIGRYWILAVLAILSAMSQLTGFKWFAIDRMMYYALFFYVGAIHKWYQKWIIDNRPLAGYMLCVAAVLYLLVIKKTETWVNSIPVVNTVIGMGFSLTVWYSFAHIKFLADNRWLNFLGRTSLEIYLLHVFFTAGFRIFFSRIGLTNAYLSIFLNFSLSTTIPMLVSVVFERFGIRNFLLKPVTSVLYIRRRNAA